MRKFINLLKKRRSHGFTLVEMIVSLALLAVLLGGMMIMVAPIIESYNNQQTNSTAQNVTTAINEYVSKRIRYANQVIVFTDTSYTELFSVQDNKDKLADMSTALNKKFDNKVYEMKCLSIKDVDGKTILCEETVTPSTGALDEHNYKKVFSDVLYNDLYVNVKVTVPEDKTPVTPAPGTDPTLPVPTKYRNDTLAIEINTYNDEAMETPVFLGSGYIELRQIKFMLEHGGKPTDYKMQHVSVTPGDDSTNDIYIYYIARKRGQPIVTTPPATP